MLKIGGTNRKEGHGFAKIINVAMELGQEVSVACVVVEEGEVAGVKYYEKRSCGVTVSVIAVVVICLVVALIYININYSLNIYRQPPRLVNTITYRFCYIPIKQPHVNPILHHPLTGTLLLNPTLLLTPCLQPLIFQ